MQLTAERVPAVHGVAAVAVRAVAEGETCHDRVTEQLLVCHANAAPLWSTHK